MAFSEHRAAFENWMHAGDRLRELIKTGGAEEQNVSQAQLMALRAEVTASQLVVNTAIAFARASSEDGPAIEGRSSAAFISSLVRIVREELAVGLDKDISDLDEAFEQWLSALGGWSPADGPAPLCPERPEGVRRVQGAASELHQHSVERAHEQLVEGFTEAARQTGKEVNEETRIGSDGSMTKTVTISLDRDDTDIDDDTAAEAEPAAAEPGMLRRPLSLASHWRLRFSPPWKVVRRDRRSDQWGETLSDHRSCSAALKAAHRGRLEVEADEVVDLLKWQWSGWVLRESLPPLASRDSLTRGDEIAEIIVGTTKTREGLPAGVTGITASPIALIVPFRKGWLIHMRRHSGEFVMPTKRLDGCYLTRADAIAGARRLAGDPEFGQDE